MGCHEQLRREVAEDTPDVVDKTATVARGLVPEADVGPRRPSEELSREAFALRHVGHVERLPVALKLGGRALTRTNIPAIRQSFVDAVNELERKLERYASDTGTTVEQASSRPLGGGAISRWLSQLSLVAWLREKCPVYAYDISDTRRDGDQKPLCHVRISQGFLSDGVVVQVTHYEGGESVAPKVLAALGAKHASTVQEGDRSPITDIQAAANPRLAWALQRADAELDTAKRLGLPSNASQVQIEALKSLVTQVRDDAEKLCRGELSTTELSRGRDGSLVVINKDYPFKIIPQKQYSNLLDSAKSISMVSFSAVGFLCGAWVEGSLMAGIVIGSMGATIGFLGGLLSGVQLAMRLHPACVNKVVKGSGPGSLGEALAEIRDAGFDVKVKGVDGHVRLTVSHRAMDVK
jgi:hypothetical protein